MLPVANFDRLALAYRWLEWFSFGPMLQRARTHFLDRLASRKNALVLGDGDGRFTARLLEAYPAMQVTAVDASGSMLVALLKSAALHRDRVTIEQADIRYWRPNSTERYDLIVTHFFLDCLSSAEVETLAQELNSVLADDAVWIVSDFAIPKSMVASMAARGLVRLLYGSFKVLTGLQATSLPDHPRALATAGWQLDAEKTRLSGLLTSQLWIHHGCSLTTRS